MRSGSWCISFSDSFSHAVINRLSCRTASFAEVTFEDPNAAMAALNDYDQHTIQGRWVHRYGFATASYLSPVSVNKSRNEVHQSVVSSSCVQNTYDLKIAFSQTRTGLDK